MMETNELKNEIEARIPYFLYYDVVNDPFLPRVYFRFADWNLSLMLPKDENYERFHQNLSDVATRFEKTLPLDCKKIWQFLLTGETDAKVCRIDKDTVKKKLFSCEPGDGSTASHTKDLTYFRLRDKSIWGAYVEDLNLIIIT